MLNNELITQLIEAIRDKKGFNIKVLDLTSIDGAPAPCFLICSGRSTSQVSALADNIREEVLKKSGRKPYHYDGYRNSQWIIVDYGDVMAHIFLPETREFYTLEELWSDAPVMEVPDEE